MLDQALDALATLADRLGKAIDFSNGFPNDTDAGYWYSMDDAVALEASARENHEAWSDDYQAALATLSKLGFVSEQSWWIDFSCPQIAFTESPVLDDAEAGVWAIGAGRWPGMEDFPAGTHGDIVACEAWPAGERPGVKRVVGEFWDNGVRHWEKVLEDIEATIRRVSETLFVMKCSLGGIGAERLGELLAKVAYDRQNRGAGRPASEVVASRRKEVANMDANGRGVKWIAEVLAPEFPGTTTDTIKNDLAWLKKQQKG